MSMWPRFSQTTKGKEFLKKAWARPAGDGGDPANVSARPHTLVERRVQIGHVLCTLKKSKSW